MRAGTPATVVLGGTDCSTTEPAATRAQLPTSILPRIFARADQHAMADLRVAVAGFLAGAAERHPLQDRDAALHHRGFADHEGGGVVEENAFAERHRRVDVGLEHFRRAALQIKREVAPAAPPHPMRQTVGLDRMEALEIQHRLDQPVGGRIAVEHGQHVRADRPHDRGVGAERLGEGVAEQMRGNLRIGEARGDAPGERHLE